MNDWEGLAAAIRQRRDELGLSQEEISVAGGPSTATLYLLETAGQTSYRGKTLAALERALGWEHGTVRALLRHEPLPHQTNRAGGADSIDRLMDEIGIPAERRELARRVLMSLVDQDRPAMERRRSG